MKTCPTCNRTYADDSLNFCLDDGATLFGSDNSSPTVAFSNRPTEPNVAEIPTQISRLPDFPASQTPPNAAPSFSPPFQFAPQVSSASKPTDNKFKYLAIAAGLLIFGVVGGLLIALGLGKWASGNTSPTNANTTVYGLTNSNSNTAVNNSNSNRVTNSNTETNKKPEPEFDLTGIWKGKFGGDSMPSTLNISNQNETTFSGTLNRKDGFVIEFTGVVNYEKLTVSMNETKIVKMPKNGAWSLGKNNGDISADGKSMKGKGKDKVTSYPWSFTKE